MPAEKMHAVQIPILARKWGQGNSSGLPSRPHLSLLASRRTLISSTTATSLDSNFIVDHLRIMRCPRDNAGDKLGFSWRRRRRFIHLTSRPISLSERQPSAGRRDQRGTVGRFLGITIASAVSHFRRSRVSIIPFRKTRRIASYPRSFGSSILS